MTPRRKDSGFAMLLIFLMAAIVAITLYMSSIRVAFDTQRQKEQLLVERGEQYRRAIQLFVRANKRWPAKIEDLENFNAKRYLRHRYKDPMTGKDEWRLIHIQNGILQDSVLNKKPSDQQQTANVNNYIGEVAGLGQALTPAQGANINAANRRRASDTAGAPGSALGPDGQPIPQQPPNGIPGAPGMPPLPGQQFPGAIQGQPFPGQPGGAPLPPGVPGIPGIPPQPGAPVNSQTGGLSPYPTAPGSQGNNPTNFPQPGTVLNGQQAQNAAGALIAGILTTPRPGGLAGLNPAGGAALGGGIAGVASTADADGIMTYNDRSNYGEWEFLYDPSKEKAPPNPNLGTVGTPASQLGSPNQSASPGPQPGIGGIGGGPAMGRAPGGIGAPGNQNGQQGQAGQPGQGGLGGNFGVGGGKDIRPGRQ